MKKSTTPTEADLARKVRAQFIQLYEACSGIAYPSTTDRAFLRLLSDALILSDSHVVVARRMMLVCDDDSIIAAAQNVRLYKSNAGIKNPTAADMAFRGSIERALTAAYALPTGSNTAKKDAGKN